MGGPRVVFVHVPKTAGVTLGSVLRRHYGEDHTLVLNTMRDGVASVADIPLEQRERARLVTGHVHHGVAEHLPGDNVHVTMLREPVARVTSLHRFVRTEPRHPLHERAVTDDIGLEQFVTSGMDRFQTDNGQVRQLAGVEEGEVTREHLDLAIDRVAHEYAVVGLTGFFDETLVLLRRALGWRMPPMYATRNVTRGSHQPPPDAAIAAVRRHNDLDVQLHRFVRERLEQQLRATRFLDVEVRAVRAGSKLATAVVARRG